MGLRIHKNDMEQLPGNDHENQFFQRRTSGSKLVYSLSRHLFKPDELYHIDPQYKQFSFKSYYLEYGKATILELDKHLVAGDLVSCSDLKEMMTLHFTEESSMIANVFNDLTNTHYHKRERSVENAMKLLEEKSPMIRMHAERVMELTSLMGIRLGYRSDKLYALNQAARYHDMGLTELTMSTIDKSLHLENIADIVSDIDTQYQQHVHIKNEKLLECMHSNVPDIIAQHHERLDGSGYPNGLKGDEIFEEARIIAICDTYDRLISMSQPDVMTTSDAFAYLEQRTGSLYDKNLFELFKEVMNEKSTPSNTIGVPPFHNDME